MSKRITLKDIKESQEDYSKYPLTYYPLSYISPYISYFFTRFLPFITPNQISFLWGFIGIFSFYLISLGGYNSMLIGILVYHFAILLDYVDGEIARATKKTTIGGTYLDGIFTYIFRGLILVAIGLGAYHTTGQIVYLYFGGISCLLLTFDNLNKLKVYETMIARRKFSFFNDTKSLYKLESLQSFRKGGFKQKLVSYVVEFLRPNAMFSLSFFAILFNITGYYLILMIFISFLIFIKNFIVIYKRIGNLTE